MGITVANQNYLSHSAVCRELFGTLGIKTELWDELRQPLRNAFSLGFQIANDGKSITIQNHLLQPLLILTVKNMYPTSTLISLRSRFLPLKFFKLYLKY